MIPLLFVFQNFVQKSKIRSEEVNWKQKKMKEIRHKERQCFIFAFLHFWAKSHD